MLKTHFPSCSTRIRVVDKLSNVNKVHLVSVKLDVVETILTQRLAIVRRGSAP